MGMGWAGQTKRNKGTFLSMHSLGFEIILGYKNTTEVEATLE